LDNGVNRFQMSSHVVLKMSKKSTLKDYIRGQDMQVMDDGEWRLGKDDRAGEEAQMLGSIRQSSQTLTAVSHPRDGTGLLVALQEAHTPLPH